LLELLFDKYENLVFLPELQFVSVHPDSHIQRGPAVQFPLSEQFPKILQSAKKKVNN